MSNILCRCAAIAPIVLGALTLGAVAASANGLGLIPAPGHYHTAVAHSCFGDADVAIEGPQTSLNHGVVTEGPSVGCATIPNATVDANGVAAGPVHILPPWH